jgi:putative membrane protein
MIRYKIIQVICFGMTKYQYLVNGIVLVQLFEAKLIIMNFILKILLTALAVFALAGILPGVAVANMSSAIWVAFAIAVLNMFVRPLLIFFTLPATIVTLGLFLFVINAIIILLAANLVGGFIVSSFFSALVFSILLSFFRSMLFKLLKDKKEE